MAVTAQEQPELRWITQEREVSQLSCQRTKPGPLEVLHVVQVCFDESMTMHGIWFLSGIKFTGTSSINQVAATAGNR